MQTRMKSSTCMLKGWSYICRASPPKFNKLQYNLFKSMAELRSKSKQKNSGIRHNSEAQTTPLKQVYWTSRTWLNIRIKHTNEFLCLKILSYFELTHIISMLRLLSSLQFLYPTVSYITFDKGPDIGCFNSCMLWNPAFSQVMSAIRGLSSNYICCTHLTLITADL